MVGRPRVPGPVSVVVRVDNRVRVFGALPTRVVAALRAETEHENPQRAKLRSMGLPHWKEPRKLVSWKDEGDHESFARGCYRRVRRILEAEGIEVRVRDEREPGVRAHGDAEVPDYGRTLWEHQERAVEAILRAQNCLIRAPTGCLVGETTIGVYRAGKSLRMRLDHVVSMFNGGTKSGRKWDRKIPTLVRSRDDSGFVRLVRLLDAYPSGTKKVYEVRTAMGHRVRASADHRFATDSGWKRLEELTVGDRLYVEDPRRKSRREKKSKKWYRLVNGLRAHPFAGRRGVRPDKGGWSVPVHRLVAEAMRSGLVFEDFVARVRAGRLKRLVFLDPKEWHVHHIDENPLNNEPSNLEVLTPEEHFARHAGAGGGWMHVVPRTCCSRITAIIERGEEPTYDLALASPHNFLANGVVVHNSGKTSVALATIARLKVPTLVVVPNGALFDQWIERVRDSRELGLPAREVGIVRAKKRTLKPVTIAMQKTLAVQGVDAQLRSTFGALIEDEVQFAPAATFYQAIDPFPAKYRVGISADERRKDRKDCLARDLFGEVACTITLEEVEAAGAIVDVEIRVVPSNFDAPWWNPPAAGFDQIFAGEKEEPEDRDFDRLLREMMADEARESLILRLVEEEARAGEQVIVFTRRREHAMTLDRRISALGIRTGVMLGGKGEDERVRRATIAGLRSGKVRVGVGTIEAVGTGTDLPTVGVGVLALPILGNKYLFRQVRGRVCRSNDGKKEGARLYVVADRFAADSTTRNMRAWNRTVYVRDADGDWRDVSK